MKKLFIPFLSLSMLVVAANADAQTTTTKTTKTEKKVTTVAKPATENAAHAAAKQVAAKKKAVKKKAVRTRPASQKEETITLDNSDDQTVVEVTNGGVYVNGDLISTIDDAKRENHKVVIRNKETVMKDNDDKKAYDKYDVEIDEAPSHRAMLGVFTSDNGEEEGARVRSVISGSPADVAGLEQGDLIVKVGGMNIRNSEDLVFAVNDHNWGEMVGITYVRNGHQEYTKADLGEITLHRVPETDDYGKIPDAKGEMTLPDPFMYSYEKKYYDRLYNNDFYYEYALKMGIVARNADNGRGVVVTSVKPNSPAETAGLMKGDVIMWLDHQRTRSVDDIHMILSYSWPNERMKVVVRRDGEMMVTHLFLTKQTFKKSL